MLSTTFFERAPHHSTGVCLYNVLLVTLRADGNNNKPFKKKLFDYAAEKCFLLGTICLCVCVSLCLFLL